MRKSIAWTIVMSIVAALNLFACGGKLGFKSAPAITHSISGTVTSSGVGVQDVTMTLNGSTTTVTDANGAFIFTDLTNGSYTLTPSKSGYEFSPPNSTQTVNKADILALSFSISPQKKYVFITSSTYKGDFITDISSAQLSPLERADSLCANAAHAGGMTGTGWRAWLSDTNTDAIDRIAEVGPWYLVGGKNTVVFNNKANLTTIPIVPIRTENGVVLSTTGSTPYVFTGTGQGGIYSNPTCSNWTSSMKTDHGKVGNISTLANWTEDDATSADCSNDYHLYCFEQ
jgi:hypothetical protein